MSTAGHKVRCDHCQRGHQRCCMGVGRPPLRGAQAGPWVKDPRKMGSVFTNPCWLMMGMIYDHIYYQHKYIYIYPYILYILYIIYYHILSYIIIYYHILSYIIIYYHILSYIIIYYHILSHIIIYYHILSYIPPIIQDYTTILGIIIVQ